MGMPASCIPVIILLLLIMSSSCKSDDTLTHAKPLSPGQKLISNGGVFALGFFSPSSSNTNLYLGIWYNQIPGRHKVWVANRDNPITTPRSATLAVTNSSDLVLSDSQGRTSWATKYNITTGGAEVAAVLLDTGNFVLRLADGTDIWQSFDHPTATILPTMKFLVSRKAQIGMRLVAWKGPDDPSSGDFSCSGDPASPDLQILIWNGTRPYYRGVWNGQPVSGGMFLSNSSSVVVQTAVDLQDELYFSFTVSPGSPAIILMLDYTGRLTSLSWNNQSSSWVAIASHPNPHVACDMYASCGPFGYCDLTATGRSMCKCLDGFEPSDVGNISKGCRRKEKVQCGKQARFVTLPQMKVPDKFLHIPNRTFQECADECSADCSCTAYAYANFSHAIAKADMSRCLVWTEELIDTAKYSGDSFFTTGKSTIFGENLYLRLAHSPGQKNNLLKIVLPVIACLLIFICITLTKIFKYRGKERKKEIQKRHILGDFNSSNGITHKNTEFPFVSFEDIAAATDNFSDSNLIGRGGFGKVYKGVLGGKEVAIKRLSESSRQGMDEFKNEIVLFAKLQHRNLVRLLGCCIHGEERLLIYEYLPNKSLDAFVFGQYVLDWPTRFRIIKGVARGLLYLHQDSRLTIVHRDLKASNILLDKDMNPKISDFGMARIFGENQQQANTTRVVGTYGYMSPEYVMGGSFSVKSDTYSFGVLLLEIVSGMKISSPQLEMDFSSLTTFAWKLWKDGNARELVDSSIVESCSLREVLRCIHVGLLCVEDYPNDRLLMSPVIFFLENGSVLLPAPKQPLYFCTRSHKTKEARKNVENSMNVMSTTIEGR